MSDAMRDELAQNLPADLLSTQVGHSYDSTTARYVAVPRGDAARGDIGTDDA